VPAPNLDETKRISQLKVWIQKNRLLNTQKRNVLEVMVFKLAVIVEIKGMSLFVDRVRVKEGFLVVQVQADLDCGCLGVISVLDHLFEN